MPLQRLRRDPDRFDPEATGGRRHRTEGADGADCSVAIMTGNELPPSTLRTIDEIAVDLYRGALPLREELRIWARVNRVSIRQIGDHLGGLKKSRVYAVAADPGQNDVAERLRAMMRRRDQL